MNINQIFDRKATIEKALHSVLALSIDNRPDPAPMVRHLIHHLTIRVCKVLIVLKKIIVAINMRHHQFLIHNRITSQ